MNKGRLSFIFTALLATLFAVAVTAGPSYAGGSCFDKGMKDTMAWTGAPHQEVDKTLDKSTKGVPVLHEVSKSANHLVLGGGGAVVGAVLGTGAGLLSEVFGCK